MNTAQNKKHIYGYLNQDHEKIKSLLNKIESLGNEESAEKTALFNELKKVLILHSEAEEKVFYHALENHSQTNAKAKHGKEEHHEAEKLLSELTSNTLKGAAWQQKLLSLKEALKHHIEEEENEMFKGAKRVLNEAQEKEMASEMSEAKARLQESEDIQTRE